MTHGLTSFPTEEMLSFEGGDIRHGAEDVGAVDDRPLNAVPLVDASVSGFLIQLELKPNVEMFSFLLFPSIHSGTWIVR